MVVEQAGQSDRLLIDQVTDVDSMLDEVGLISAVYYDVLVIVLIYKNYLLCSVIIYGIVVPPPPSCATGPYPIRSILKNME